MLESIQQILVYYENSPEIMRKMYILDDCMSPIPGFEDVTDSTFETFKRKYQVAIAKSTDKILN